MPSDSNEKSWHSRSESHTNPSAVTLKVKEEQSTFFDEGAHIVERSTRAMPGKDISMNGKDPIFHPARSLHSPTFSLQHSFQLPQHPSMRMSIDGQSHNSVSGAVEEKHLQRPGLQYTVEMEMDANQARIAMMDNIAGTLVSQAVENGLAIAVHARMEANQEADRSELRRTATFEVTNILREATSKAINNAMQSAMSTRAEPSHDQQSYRHYRSRSALDGQNLAGPISGRQRGRSRSPEPEAERHEAHRHEAHIHDVGHSLGGRMDLTDDMERGSSVQYTADLPGTLRHNPNEYNCGFCRAMHSYKNGRRHKRCPNRCPCNTPAKHDHLREACKEPCQNPICGGAVHNVHRALDCRTQCAICGQKGKSSQVPHHAGSKCEQVVCPCGKYGHWAHSCPEIGQKKTENLGLGNIPKGPSASRHQGPPQAEQQREFEEMRKARMTPRPIGHHTLQANSLRQQFNAPTPMGSPKQAGYPSRFSSPWPAIEPSTQIRDERFANSPANHPAARENFGGIQPINFREAFIIRGPQAAQPQAAQPQAAQSHAAQSHAAQLQPAQPHASQPQTVQSHAAQVQGSPRMETQTVTQAQMNQYYAALQHDHPTATDQHLQQMMSEYIARRHQNAMRLTAAGGSGSPNSGLNAGSMPDLPNNPQHPRQPVRNHLPDNHGDPTELVQSCSRCGRQGHGGDECPDPRLNPHLNDRSTRRPAHREPPAEQSLEYGLGK